MSLMIRTLQLSSHIPLTKVLIQANLIEFINVLKPLLEFDILESVLNWDDQSILTFNTSAVDKFKETFPQQAQEVEYDNFNTLRLLNTLGIVILFYLFKVLMYGKISIYVKLTHGKYGGVKLKNWLEKNLFFSELHIIYI